MVPVGQVSVFNWLTARHNNRELEGEGTGKGGHKEEPKLKLPHGGKEELG
jgi:hypothetical protein